MVTAVMKLGNGYPFSYMKEYWIGNPQSTVGTKSLKFICNCPYPIVYTCYYIVPDPGEIWSFCDGEIPPTLHAILTIIVIYAVATPIATLATKLN